MKKCTSCTKDLPDAALHCVFCGAKQPAAPSQPAANMAKTVMGYSAQEMIAQIRQQGIPGATPPAPAATPVAAPVAAPMATPHAAGVPMMQPAVQQSAGTSAPVTRPAPYQGPAPMNPQLAATIAPAQMNAQLNPQLAATIAPQQMSPFAAPPAGNPGAASVGGPSGGSMGAAVLGTGSGPGPGPGPSVGTPAVGGGGVLTGAQPIVVDDRPAPSSLPAPPRPKPMTGTGGGDTDALRGPVRAMMLFAGVMMLLSLVVPLSVDPLVFPFEVFKTLGDMDTSAMISTLLGPIIAVVALIVALLSMPTTVKGIVALLIGIAGLATAINGVGKVEWQSIVMLASQVLLFGGLVIRSRFYGSMAGRILATLGVVMFLAVWLVPTDGGGIPVVGIFDGFSGDTEQMVITSVTALGLLTSVLGLLVWMPATSSGGTGALAWLALLFTLGGIGFGEGGFVLNIAAVAVTDIGRAFQFPATLLAWVPITSLLGLAGWGLAGVLGKPAT